ncbi:MAG TPA: DUF3105 domain-containing protein [Actinomycetota bacterium]|nr:DUF3105 domain-containing protein [Actinomycetota bacterium]
MNQPPPPGYAEYPQPQPLHQRTNGMAVAALIFGILGLTALFGFGSIFALIFGYVARGQIDRSNGTETGRGMATAGVVMGWIGAIVAIVLVAAVLIGLMVVVTNVGREGLDAIGGQVRHEIARGLLEVDPEQAGCTAVESYPNQGRKHIPSGAPHVDYNSKPPTSGPHWAAPASRGFHVESVAPEEIVGNLERGDIVLWYRVDGSEVLHDQMQVIAAQEPRATLAVPYTEVPDGYSFYLTAWRHAQLCRQASQQVIDSFRARFQGRGPQRGTPVFRQ